MDTIAPVRGPGRPRRFDADVALDRAVRVFSERGYHATSINDLAEAMELAQGSIYKAFGDKRGVYIAALERYHTVRTQLLEEAAASGRTGRQKLRNALMFFADSSFGEEGRRGCLVVGSASELAAFDDEAAAKVAAALVRKEKLMAGYLEEGIADGSVDPGTDAAAAARFMLCVVNGMRVTGKTGRSREEMADVVELAMRAL
ncbi:TetR/AcrR family transcriptional regulator [Martelella endophytica]|uniref:HTH tetR-type domain-containing protein n=1 Tax=Martelella endophytica TaxID=1486262 RepID=A0A0D5LWP6_MAREN|nr:TetR/AcrR family transcriptional regulator [Martelella endophytica]AJY47843.1 hypothetical protein TM49_01280 [Martelella endophytica]